MVAAAGSGGAAWAGGLQDSLLSTVLKCAKARPKLATAFLGYATAGARAWVWVLPRPRGWGPAGTAARTLCRGTTTRVAWLLACLHGKGQLQCGSCRLQQLQELLRRRLPRLLSGVPCAKPYRQA